MAIQTPATTKMVQNIIDGTTPVKNMMSTNTDQTITGQKVFENGKLIIKDKNGDNFTPVPYYETTETDLNNLPKVLGYFYNESGFTINTPLGARIKLVYQRMFSNGSNSWGYQECLENAIVQRRSFNVSWGEWRIMEPFSFSGNSKLPVYIRDNGQPQPIEYTLDDACAKAVSDSSSASALSSTDTNVPTVRDIYYGTPTINGSKAYTSSTNIYAPTTGGTPGAVLVANGTGAPGWENNFFNKRVSLYESTSLTTGTKSMSNYSSYNLLLCVLKGGALYYPFLIPRSEFSARSSSSNKLCLNMSTSASSKYIALYTTSNTSFYLDTVSEVDGLQIFGM
jgi:hypothetical protein